ncbi:MAG: hypothetical protein JWQ80_2658 [Massilia sp.]|nr:hypothetical protein [Massilia sp.]
MEEKSMPSGRELFPLFLAKILTQLIDAFPCQSNIELQRFVRPDTLNLSTFGSLPESLKGTSLWKTEERKAKQYKDEVELQRHELAVARGTLLFLLSSGYINAPDESILEFHRARMYSLNDCSLSEKGYTQLFRKPDEDIERLVERVVEQKTSGTQTSSLQSRDQGGFSHIPNILLDLVKQAGKAVSEQTVNVAMEQLIAKILGG